MTMPTTKMGSIDPSIWTGDQEREMTLEIDRSSLVARSGLLFFVQCCFVVSFGFLLCHRYSVHWSSNKSREEIGKRVMHHRRASSSSSSRTECVGISCRLLLLLFCCLFLLASVRPFVPRGKQQTSDVTLSTDFTWLQLTPHVLSSLEVSSFSWSGQALVNSLVLARSIPVCHMLISVLKEVYQQWSLVRAALWFIYKIQNRLAYK